MRIPHNNQSILLQTKYHVTVTPIIEYDIHKTIHPIISSPLNIKQR
jgi:hypothetical protein